MINRVLSTMLGIIGGIAGAVFGFVLFFWIARQGFYALVIPGASLGLGCGLLARHPSNVRGAACAIAALVLGLFTEWMFAPFVVDAHFGYLLQHFYELRPLTLIMIGLGAALAFYLGKEAGFLAPRTGDGAAPQARAKVGQSHDLDD
jgi:F0F1-type ATP synthase assembly protein I